MTQLQNTKLLAMGGLGTKRVEFCGGTRQQKRQRDVLKRSLVEIRLLAGGRGGIGPDPEGMLRLAHAGTAHPQKGRRQSCTPPKKRGEGGGRGGDAGGDHCHLHLAGTDPAKPNGGAQGWGVAASPWFPLRYPSRTELRPLARGKEGSVRGVILHPISLLSHPEGPSATEAVLGASSSTPNPSCPARGPLPMDGLPSWWFKLLVSALGSSPGSPGLVTPGILGR